MRDIKFRGLCVETGKWVYGMLTETVCGGNYHRYIIPIEEKPVRVDCKTIGQYTGVNSKGVFGAIYEGDIYHQGDPKIKYEVIFKNGAFVGKQLGNESTAGLGHWIDRVEVVGNIHL